MDSMYAFHVRPDDSTRSMMLGAARKQPLQSSVTPRVPPAARTAACTEVIGDLLKSPNRPMAGRLPLPIDYRAFSLDRPPGPRPECPGATRLTPPQVG